MRDAKIHRLTSYLMEVKDQLTQVPR
jgi:hypothetical protein